MGKAIYFGGDIINAAQAVIDGEMERDAFSFVIGASCWESGQLESEINKGYWLPCSAPPIITLTGRSEDDKGDIKSNLWLSMMCSLGNHEARLANLLENE